MTTAPNPVEHDRQYVERMLDLAVARQTLAFKATAVHRAAGDDYRQYDGPRTPARWGTSDAEALRIAADGVAADEYREQADVVNAIIAAIAAMERIYDEAPWARFWLVPGGHLHSSMDCSTCNHDGNQTSFTLCADLSGATEEAAVEEYGSTLCTVCYPTAPVDWTDGSRMGRVEREARDSKAAEKAAKRAAMLEKALLPDGSELHLQGYDRPKTLIAGQRALSSALQSLAMYGTHPSENTWRADARTLAEAIAAKTGEDVGSVLMAAAAKAATKARREGWWALQNPAEILAGIVSEPSDTVSAMTTPHNTERA